jgi:serine/threonine-protein kinase
MTDVDWTQVRRSLMPDSDVSVLPPNIPLPMLPHAVTEFSRRAEDANAGVAELGRIIETDSGLTCELLKYVNSSKFGMRVKSSSAQQAIAKLGVRNSKLFLLTAGIQHAMKSCKSKLINFQSFWLTNLERALFAKEVAKLLNANADVTFAGSMLHDFLLPMLSNEMFDKYIGYLEMPDEERPPLIDYERRTFGWDHARATAQILQSWSFPDELICCVLLHHAGAKVLGDEALGKTPVAAVAVAALIPDSLHQSGRGMEQLLELDAAWPDFQLTALAARVARELFAMTPMAQQHFSLQRRCERLAVGGTA